MANFLEFLKSGKTAEEFINTSVLPQHVLPVTKTDTSPEPYKELSEDCLDESSTDSEPDKKTHKVGDEELTDTQWDTLQTKGKIYIMRDGERYELTKDGKLTKTKEAVEENDITDSENWQQFDEDTDADAMFIEALEEAIEEDFEEGEID